MKNRGSRWAELARETRRESRPPEGRRPPGGTETVTSTRGTAPPDNALSPAAASTTLTITRMTAVGMLGVGIRMAPIPPRPQRDQEERCPVDYIALEHPVRDEQDQRGKDPERELEPLEVEMVSEDEDRQEADLGRDEEIPRDEHVPVAREGRESDASRGLKRRERREHRRSPSGRIPREEGAVDQEEDAGRDPAEGEERLPRAGRAPVPVPQEQEGRQQPRSLFERARDSIPEPGAGRPSQIRGHEEGGDHPEDIGHAPRRVLHELERRHEADRRDAAERGWRACVEYAESREGEGAIRHCDGSRGG